MRDPIILLVHLIATLARLMGPGGLRSVVAESVLVKQQLLILNRSRHRAPNLCASDRILAGVCALCMRPARVIRSAIVLRPSTILEFHRALRTRKYRWLFSPTRRRTGPQGPSKALVDAIVGTACWRNAIVPPRAEPGPRGCRSSDTRQTVCGAWTSCAVRPSCSRATGCSWSWTSSRGASWDSVCIADRVDAPSLCRMFNAAIHGRRAPQHLSTDHDPLFEAHRWTANLRLLEIDEIKTVPHVPLSHPFVERLIGTMRRECLDHVLCWNAGDLERKLADFQAYYNAARSHASLEGYTPLGFAGERTAARAEFNHVRWISHCRGMVQLPAAA